VNSGGYVRLTSPHRIDGLSQLSDKTGGSTFILSEFDHYLTELFERKETKL